MQDEAVYLEQEESNKKAKRRTISIVAAGAVAGVLVFGVSAFGLKRAEHERAEFSPGQGFSAPQEGGFSGEPESGMDAPQDLSDSEISPSAPATPFGEGGFGEGEEHEFENGDRPRPPRGEGRGNHGGFDGRFELEEESEEQGLESDDSQEGFETDKSDEASDA
jgi:hypothetical protein